VSWNHSPSDPPLIGMLEKRRLRVAWLRSLCSTIYDREQTSRVWTLSPPRCRVATLVGRERIVDAPHKRIHWIHQPLCAPSLRVLTNRANPPTLATSGPMSYNAAMHRNLSAYLSFSNSHSHPQQPQPPFGNGYNPSTPQ